MFPVIVCSSAVARRPSLLLLLLLLPPSSLVSVDEKSGSRSSPLALPHPPPLFPGVWCKATHTHTQLPFLPSLSLSQPRALHTHAAAADTFRRRELCFREKGYIRCLFFFLSVPPLVCEAVAVAREDEGEKEGAKERSSNTALSFRVRGCALVLESLPASVAALSLAHGFLSLPPSCALLRLLSRSVVRFTCAERHDCCSR